MLLVCNRALQLGKSVRQTRLVMLLFLHLMQRWLLCNPLSLISPLSWNCQGFRNTRTVRELCSLLRVKCLSIIFLMETKCSRVQMDSVRRNVGYPNYFVVDSVGKGGELASIWGDDTCLKVVNYSQYHIYCEVEESEQDDRFLITGFYGRSVASERRASWDLLGRINQGTTLLWCVIGDFNEIATQDEKLKADCGL